jgi:hypothetical protein
MNRIYLAQILDQRSFIKESQTPYGFSDIGTAMLSVFNLIIFFILLLMTILGAVVLLKRHTKEFTFKFLGISVVSSLIGAVAGSIAYALSQYLFAPAESNSYYATYSNGEIYMRVIAYSSYALTATIVARILHKKFNAPHATWFVTITSAFFAILPTLYITSFLMSY